MFVAGWLLDIPGPNNTRARYCTFPSAVTVGGIEYESLGFEVGVASIDGGRRSTLPVSLILESPEGREFWADEPGYLPAKVSFAVMETDGPVVKVEHAGLIDGPTLDGWILSVGILRGTEHGDTLAVSWSDAYQRFRFQGDSGFGRIAEAARREILTALWP